MAGGKIQAEPTMDRGVMMLSGGVDVVGTGSSQKYTIVNANCNAIRFSVTVASVRVLPGDSTVTVSTTTGMEIQSGSYDVMALKPGITDIAYIGNTGNINIVELY